VPVVTVSYGAGLARLWAEALRRVDATPGLQRLLWTPQDDQVSRRTQEAQIEKARIVGARQERQAAEDRERLERERLKAIRVAEKQEWREAKARARARARRERK
jgi:hypothetical protein